MSHGNVSPIQTDTANPAVEAPDEQRFTSEGGHGHSPDIVGFSSTSPTGPTGSSPRAIKGAAVGFIQRLIRPVLEHYREVSLTLAALGCLAWIALKVLS